MILKKYLYQRGGDDYLKDISEKNTDEKYKLNVYFINDDTLAYELDYTQTYDEDTVKAMVDYFEENMETTIRGIWTDDMYEEMHSLNMSPFIVKVIVNNGDGTYIYSTNVNFE